MPKADFLITRLISKSYSQIYEALKEEGYEVWIDVEHMSGYENLLEGMANAVENAWLVLICFSEKYKLSQNCRTGRYLNHCQEDVRCIENFVSVVDLVNSKAYCI